MSNASNGSGGVGRELARVVALPTLWLLLVPLLTIALAAHGRSSFDARVLEYIDREIDADAGIPAEAKGPIKARYRELPPSVVCDAEEPELASYRNDVCARWSDQWQFVWVGRGAWVALWVGVFAILFAAALGGVAYLFPAAQYGAYVVGSRSLVLLSAAEVLVQGLLAVWLSYWGTALLMSVYVPKLIVIVAVLALLGIGAAIKGLFARAPESPPVEGEVVGEADAPRLWERLTRLAGLVGTRRPDSLVAGIDDNFFVTEAPLRVGDRTLTGRSLFVSLPLLRLLRGTEADAVLAHELAHFRGGDTKASARLGPSLRAFGTYVDMLGAAPTTLPARYVLHMFQVFFELGQRRSNRERELVADRVAAEHTSADAFARALLKVVTYSSHRARTEDELFGARETHGVGLGLASRIAAGVGEYARSPQFRDAAANHDVPHPFDSHPPVKERLGKLGSTLGFDDCSQLLDAPPEETWLTGEDVVAAVEQRLWGAYEARFREAHDLSLAYRYLPANDAERAHVERLFPPVTIVSTAGEFTVTFDGLQQPGKPFLRFVDLGSATIDEGNFSTALILAHKIDGNAGPGPSRVELRAFGDQRPAFEHAFGRYYGRAQTALDVAARAFAIVEEPATDENASPPPPPSSTPPSGE